MDTDFSNTVCRPFHKRIFFSQFVIDVHQFDAHEIPFDGPNGIIALVQRLLTMSPLDLGPAGKRKLLDRFVKIILQQAGNNL